MLTVRTFNTLQKSFGFLFIKHSVGFQYLPNNNNLESIIITIVLQIIFLVYLFQNDAQSAEI